MNKDRSSRIDCVLIYPPWVALSSRGVLQNSLPPLGVLSIASHLEQSGYTVEVIDVHAKRMGSRALRDLLVKYKPRYVGISVLTNMSLPGHSIARLCKEVAPDCVVVVGGVHAEAMPERMLQNSAIDVVVRGDGEKPMAEIVAGRPWGEILGISYRLNDTTVRHTPVRELEMDLDKLPFPAYQKVNFRDYFPSIGSYRRLPAASLLMTLGCPGACTFCNSAWTKLRSRSPRSVVDQIKVLRYEYGIRQVQFMDDTFTVAKRHVLEFCRLMRAEKVDVSWICFIRGDCFSEEIAAALKSSGCHQVLLGVETGSPKIMQNIGKPIDKDRYRRTVSIAKDHGLEVRGSFIIGNMGETWETMEESLEFATELDIDIFQLFISTPYPGTQLYKQAVEEGRLIHEDWSKYGQGEVLVRLDDLTPEDIYRFEKYAFRKFYLRPRMLGYQLKRISNWRHLRDLVVAWMVLILNRVQNPEPKWDEWQNLAEEDFCDYSFAEPEKIHLTYELRQTADYY